MRYFEYLLRKMYPAPPPDDTKVSDVLQHLNKLLGCQVAIRDEAGQLLDTDNMTMGDLRKDAQNRAIDGIRLG